MHVVKSMLPLRAFPQWAELPHTAMTQYVILGERWNPTYSVHVYGLIAFLRLIAVSVNVNVPSAIH